MAGNHSTNRCHERPGRQRTTCRRRWPYRRWCTPHPAAKRLYWTGFPESRPDADALRTLANRILCHGQEVSAVIESMTGSRFVHDTLERLGWEVAIADPVKAKGLAPLAAKTDKIDAHVLAELARRDLVPEIWLPTPGVRAERERARFRLHLIHHRSALKCRIHATLMSFGHPVPVTDLFGARGRDLLAGVELPEPWASTMVTSLAMVDELDERIDECGRELARLGADHPYIPLLLTVPGIGPLLAYTIASAGRMTTLHRIGPPAQPPI